MYKSKLGLLCGVVAVALLCLFSTSFRSDITHSKQDTAHDIIHKKWSRNPYEGSDGMVTQLGLMSGEDYNEYYAFNSDRTVDHFGVGNDKTGSFSIDGNMVVCLFVEPVFSYDSDTADDGNYNLKVVFEYKEGKLYCYDELTRNKDGRWVSRLPLECRTLYYDDAGHYVNHRYNVERGSLRREYDTTVDAMAVVERFNWRRETYYKKGKRDGVYKCYVGGRLRVFGRYSGGRPVGVWYYFSSVGTLYAEVTDIKLAPENMYQSKYVANGVRYLMGSTLECKVYMDDDAVLYWDD